MAGELEAGLRTLPQAPFFAFMVDPRAHLTPLQMTRGRHLASRQAFVVVEIGVDRTHDMPGVWFRAVASNARRWVSKAGPDELVQDGSGFKAAADVWLNSHWCTVLNPFAPGFCGLSSFNCNPNWFHYPPN